MRPGRMLQRVLGMSARNRSINLLWAVPGAALALGATVILIIVIGSATSGHGDPIDPAHQPTIAEGPTNRIALREGWFLIRDPKNLGGHLGYAQGRLHRRGGVGAPRRQRVTGHRG